MIYCDFVLRYKREKKDMFALLVCSHFQPCEPMHFPQQGHSRLQHQGSFFMLMRMELCCAVIPAPTEFRDSPNSVSQWARATWNHVRSMLSNIQTPQSRPSKPKEDHECQKLRDMTTGTVLQEETENGILLLKAPLRVIC